MHVCKCNCMYVCMCLEFLYIDISICNSTPQTKIYGSTLDSKYMVSNSLRTRSAHRRAT